MMPNGAQQQSSPTHSLPECPVNLLDFQRMFPDEAACLQYLEKMRWPSGFVCEKCLKDDQPFSVAARPRGRKCRSCHHESSVTAGTVKHRSKTSIHVWFWAAYLVATQTPGVSAMELQKPLGISRYETSFPLLHKRRSALVRPHRDKIGDEWPLELDIVFVGGKTKGRGHGKTDQVPVLMAVEIRRREVRNPKTHKVMKRALAGRIRIQKLPDKSATSVDTFAKNCLAPGAAIVSDDGTEFTNLLHWGDEHRPVPMHSVVVQWKRAPSG